MDTRGNPLRRRLTPVRPPVGPTTLATLVVLTTILLSVIGQPLWALAAVLLALALVVYACTKYIEANRREKPDSGGKPVDIVAHGVPPQSSPTPTVLEPDQDQIVR